MWKIDKNNVITLTRGDTPSFKLNLTTIDEAGETVPYEPVEGDSLIFVVKKDAKDNDIWVRIEIPTDTMVLTFEEEHTKGLQFGTYVYEISINNDGTGYHDTFIANTPIKITEELY